MLRKLLNFLTGRLFISIVLICVQLLLLFNILGYAQNNALWIQALYVLTIVMTLVVVVRDLNPAYKIGWMLLFMLFPLYGGVFYVLFGNRRLNKRLRERLEQLNIFYEKGVEGGAYSDLLPMRALERYSNTLARQSEYIVITGIRCSTPGGVLPGEAGLSTCSRSWRRPSISSSWIFILAKGRKWDLLTVLLEKIRWCVCLMS